MVNNDIKLDYDQENGEYYIVWEPVILSAGSTECQALEELRGAAHSGVDTLIDQRLQKLKKEG